MTLNQLNEYFCNYLKIADFKNDISMNGIQVQNSAPDSKEIRTVAFAVDACLETIEKAAASGADLLFVHHGLFWGSPIAVSGSHYKRIKALLDSDMALFACHIPLDAHPVNGNNAGLAKRMNLSDLKAFGSWRGMILGFVGNLPEPVKFTEFLADFFPNANVVLPFGKESVQRVAVISGGAAEELEDAIAEGADLYITGELGHQQYHVAKEAGINAIAGGHYNTETVGVSLMMEKVRTELGINTVFVDVPTRL